MAGDTEGSLVRPEMRGDRVVDYFGQLGQAWLYERARRYDEAETDYKALTGGDAPGDIAVQAYGAFLERRNRRADAVALYDASLALQPNNENLIAARARAAAGKSAPAAPNLRQGAAQVLVAPAATMLAAKQEQLGLAYLRLALRLDPNRDTAWLMVGDIMEAAGDVTGARAAYARPKPGSNDYSAARNDMLTRTHTPVAPWTCVVTDKKKQARLNVMRHVIKTIAPEEIAADVEAPDPDILFPFQIDAVGRLNP